MPRDFTELSHALELQCAALAIAALRHSDSSYHFHERALCMPEMLQTARPIEMSAPQLKLRLIRPAC